MTNNGNSSTASSSNSGAMPNTSGSSAATQTPQQRPATPDASRITGGVGSTYRPAPVADVNRPAGLRPAMPEAPRPAAPAAAGASTEKSIAIKTNRRVLTVGNDILLKGEIATCDRLVIEGRVEAKLSEVHTVEIAECGSFKGTAEVEDAEISGVFEGDLVVRNRIVIYATGEVRGNISYGEIEIERGGRLMGEIKTVQNKGKANSDNAAKIQNQPPVKESAAA